jgi:hypothetical protein
VGVERRIEQEGERAVESLGCYLRVAVIATVDIAKTRLDGIEAYDRVQCRWMGAGNPPNPAFSSRYFVRGETRWRRND